MTSISPAAGFGSIRTRPNGLIAAPSTESSYRVALSAIGLDPTCRTRISAVKTSTAAGSLELLIKGS
jgi:hypothetical protein